MLFAACPSPLRRWWLAQALLMLLSVAWLWAGPGAARAQSSLDANPALPDGPTRVMRVASLDGEALWFDPEARSWQPLLRNQALAAGDRVRVRDGARVGLRLGQHALWLDEGSALELLRLDDQGLELMLDRGAVALRWLTATAADEARVLTREGQLRFEGRGDYRIDQRTQSTRVQVFAGRLRFEPRDAAPAWLDTGEQAEWRWDGGWRIERSRLQRADAFGQWLLAELDFGQVDGGRWARWSDRPAYRYVSPDMTGADELDAHGSWSHSPEYGPVWIPARVAVDWSPFREGRWTWRVQWGWTWVDDVAWGFTTSHYGRWVQWGGRWCWAPGPVRAVRPVFVPARVAPPHPPRAWPWSSAGTPAWQRPQPDRPHGPATGRVERGDGPGRGDRQDRTDRGDRGERGDRGDREDRMERGRPDWARGEADRAVQPGRERPEERHGRGVGGGGGTETPRVWTPPVSQPSGETEGLRRIGVPREAMPREVVPQRAEPPRAPVREQGREQAREPAREPSRDAAREAGREAARESGRGRGEPNGARRGNEALR